MYNLKSRTAQRLEAVVSNNKTANVAEGGWICVIHKGITS